MLKWMKKRISTIKDKRLRVLLLAAVSMTFLLVISTVATFTYLYSLGPPSLTSNQNTIYYSSSNQVIGEEHGPESRYWVSLEAIDSKVIEATLTTEDRRFYEHNGLDFKRILGAALKDIQSMSKVQGASTITQQYARNLYLSHEKTWTRKIKEAFYAIRLEIFYDKKEILEGYLNTIYYGHGAYGIEAASRYFFNKSADDLSLAESALLAAIPKGPSLYSPLHNYQNAKNRQEQILASLANQEIISEQDQFLAKHENIQLTKPKEREKVAIAPHFQDVVLKELSGILNEDLEDIRSGGYQVFTTLNVDYQSKLEKTVNSTMSVETSIEIGAMSIDPNSGAITSIIGGSDYKTSQFNRAIQASRMPGSAFKPFLYYTALENGYTATTPLMSKPTNFELADGTVYAPSNYNGYYADKPITLAQAIAVSDNVYAVKTNLFLTPERLVETARKFGIKSKLQAVPSLALGTEAVSVKEMVAGYGMLASGGKKIDPYTIDKVTDIKGNVLYERPSQESEVVLDKRKAFILTNLMTGMFDRSLNGYTSVTGSSITDQLTRQYAGKSGTTRSDSWMVGYSPDVVTGVWIGYDDNRPIEKTAEHQYAKNIWAKFMEKAHENEPLKTFDVPEGVVGAYVDPSSGDLASPYCEQQRLMYFVKGTEPTTHCSLHLPDESTEEIDTEDQHDNEEDKKGLGRFFDWIPFIGNN
ncbi:transglycosylase domain-containing protein [Aquibacillus saliphilus]|uniref:transglycosylase domain-containing protein n=1 Tax=Aquibacillus saliphilus TaxID=1909422 RepID=UPI001CEFC5FF|nr:PBP1A family penicillin-binding protein [Aquibacillus saliphilus]